MKYLINADDFGRTDKANRAITELFEKGLLDRTTIMVNTPAFEQAVEIAKKNGFFDKTGLHFNIITGVPLTEDIKKCKTFCSEKGRFNSAIFRSKRMKLFLFPKERHAVKKELLAQIKKYKETGFSLMHMDSHGHTHTFPSLSLLCLAVAKKEGIKSIRLTRNYQVKGIAAFFKRIENNIVNRFNKKSNRFCEYFDSLQVATKALSELKNETGVFEVMVHPEYRFGDKMQIEYRTTYSALYVFDNYHIDSVQTYRGQ